MQYFYTSYLFDVDSINRFVRVNSPRTKHSKVNYSRKYANVIAELWFSSYCSKVLSISQQNVLNN